MHHILGWLSVLFFWYQYYSAVDPAITVPVSTCICTVFAAISFYWSYYYVSPSIVSDTSKSKLIARLIIGLIVLTLLRSLSIYLSFRYYDLADKYWRFFKNSTTSFFHIVYAFTVAALIYFFKSRYETKQRLDAIMQENLKAELLYLRHQINPHFLFNIHNNINFLISSNPSLASSTLLKLSDIMRYQLYDCNEEVVPLSKEIECIENFVQLERMRLLDWASIEMNITVLHTVLEIAPFILLTFIENATKYVSKKEDGPNLIKIDIKENNGILIFSVINTVNDHHTLHADGLGLKNVKRRLELIYPGSYRLHHQLEDSQYKVMLQLKLV